VNSEEKKDSKKKSTTDSEEERIGKKKEVDVELGRLRLPNMGYGCIICDECLEVQAPEYDTGEVKTEGPAEAAGSAEAAAAATAATATTSRRGNARKPASPKKGARNIRNGGPADIVVTPCGHLFHRICIARWFKDKNSMNCPACRKLCKQSGLIRIFPAVVTYHPALNDSLDYVPQTRVQPAHTAVHGPGPIQNTPAAFPTVQDVFQAFTRNPNPNEDDDNSSDDDNPGVRFVGGVNNNNGGAGRPAVPPPQEDKCTRPECEDIAFLHQTLIQDFEEVQTKYATALEDLTMQQATEQSYDDMIKTQAALIVTLQRERDELEGKLKERVTFNQQCIQVGLKQSNQMVAMNRELDEATATPTATQSRTRQGVRKRQSDNKSKEDDSPSKRLRNNDDNPPAGGSNTVVA